LLCTLLIYVTLDLSLAMMPGAFMFEAEASVESAHGSRGRAGADVVVAPRPAANRSILRPPPIPVRNAAVSHAITPLARTIAQCLPRATLVPAPLAVDDPH
jgi:hypothetical protein